ncbi:MAG: hypothetical protein WCH62_02095 [Candidatus Omnitrophota bacterium]
MDKPLLGEILIKRKRITKEQLDQALDYQRKEGGFIGEILVKLGFVEERDIVVALVVQCDLPYIAVNKYTIDPEVLKLIPKEVAIKEKVIPLDRIGDVLSVVMTNPLNQERKIKLEMLTNCRIATFISTKTEIEEAIARFYDY